MLKEIQNNDNFNKVFDTGKSATQNVTISEKEHPILIFF